MDNNAKTLWYTALGLYLFGALLAGFGVYFYFLASAAESWPSVEGEVISTKVRMSVSRVGDAAHRTYEYYPVIQYKYEVNGIEYAGERYQLGTTMEKFKEKKDATEMARGYPTGSKIPIYYDPNDPSGAVIEPSFSYSVFVPSLLGILFLLSGWALHKGAKKIQTVTAANPA